MTCSDSRPKFPPEIEPADLAYGDLRFVGDLGVAGTAQIGRVSVVPTLIMMAGRLFTWCRHGLPSVDLTSSEVRRVVSARHGPSGVLIRGPDGPAGAAAYVAEVWRAFHTGAIGRSVSGDDLDRGPARLLVRPGGLSRPVPSRARRGRGSGRPGVEERWDSRWRQDGS